MLRGAQNDIAAARVVVRIELTFRCFTGNAPNGVLTTARHAAIGHLQIHHIAGTQRDEPVSATECGESSIGRRAKVIPNGHSVSGYPHVDASGVSPRRPGYRDLQSRQINSRKLSSKRLSAIKKLPLPRQMKTPGTRSGNLAIEVHLTFDLHVQPLQDLQQRIPRHVLIILALYRAICRECTCTSRAKPSMVMRAAIRYRIGATRRFMQRKDTQFLCLGFLQLLVILNLLFDLCSKLRCLPPSRSNHGLRRLGMSSKRLEPSAMNQLLLGGLYCLSLRIILITSTSYVNETTKIPFDLRHG